MRLPEALTKPNAENTFCGVRIAQSWNDLALWEEFLNRYRVASILELGTWTGAMAAYFAFQGLARGISVVSVDSNPGIMECGELLGRLAVETVHLDLLGPSAIPAMEALVGRMPKPLMLFCDNGNKPAEYCAFVPLLSGGDYVAVHDWGTEIQEADLNPALPMLLQHECETISSLTRFFAVQPS